jgi:D-alanyl-lipoteichoic acid acyltransferase DltB (MBOAT superfamily)
MLFNSQLFLIVFLPVALTLQWIVAEHARWWIANLLFLSAIFYSYWNPPLLLLLIGSILVNWWTAQQFGRTRNTAWLTAGIVADLVVLGTFKYLDFFLGSIASLAGLAYHPFALALPLGISFFSFQQIGYIVDLRRGEAKPHPLVRYALYVSFFPHLIAGPLLRHSEFFASLDRRRPREESTRLYGQGLALIVLGLMKKVLVADNLGFAVNQLYALAAAGPLSFAEGWLAGLGFAMQIYLDFSGYSDIAIGLGLLFGIVIPDNFDAPYRTTCVIEFWRRWHMTLSRMLRDYLYISLGGSRYGLSRQVAALLVTMLLGGLWHGAGWTFVIWGGLHGVALTSNHLWRRGGAAMPAPLSWIVTFLFVVTAFVIFRADSMSTARHVLDAMAGAHGLSWQVQLAEPGWRPPLFGSILNETMMWLAIALAFALAGPTSQVVVRTLLKPRWPIAVGLAIILSYLIVELGGEGGAEFVYFQF